MTLMEKVKLVFKAREPLQDLIREAKEVKRGYKTFSFWFTIVGCLISLVAAIAGYIPGTVGIILTTGLTALYSILRGLKKADEVGVRPIFLSTEFWISVLSSISNAFVGLQQGGVNPEWIVTAQMVITVILGAAQNLAGNQPEEKK